MGFAASQARLLLLTARKSDLEFRAQQITNAEMMLAMQSEEIADEYSRKLSNQTVKIIDGNDEIPLNYANLAASGYTVERYSDGKWTKLTGQENTGVATVYALNTSAINEALENGTITEEQAAELNSLNSFYSEEEWEELTRTLNLGEDINLSSYFTTSQTSTNIFAAGQDIGPQILEGINRGQIRILNASGEEVSVHNGTGFSVRYNTQDDEAADAEYRRKSSALHVKEKRLQMELQQIEAQQKACDAEIEGVKKVMEKNIEKTFKVFS